MQLATELEGHAIRPWKEALSSIVLSLGGTQATGLVKFLIDTFGGSNDYEAAKAQILAQAPTPEDLEDDVLSNDGEEGGPSSTPAASSDDICFLKDAKPFFPSCNDLLSATGVPNSFISDNIPQGPSHQSSYNCLYGGVILTGGRRTPCADIFVENISATPLSAPTARLDEPVGGPLGPTYPILPKSILSWTIRSSGPLPLLSRSPRLRKPLKF